MNNNILNKIPSSFSEITLQQYIELLKIEIPSEEDKIGNVDNLLKMVSIFISVPFEELIDNNSEDILILTNKLSFLNQTIKPKKTKLKLKDFKDISFNDYIEISQLMNEDLLFKLDLIIQSFIVDSSVNVLDLKIDECFYILEIIKKKSLKYQTALIRKMILQQIKMIAKQTIINLFKKKKTKLENK